MCRLYGFHASEATKVECTLVHAQNALLIQSRADLRGVAHTDGWGIACYAGPTIDVERRETAAHSDVQFSATAERIYAETVVAHIRRATVGTPSVVNTHPFRHGRWVFAHNGTVTGFDELASELERETDASLQSARLGTTDSEQVFYWLLTRMRRSGIDLASPAQDVERVEALMASSIVELAARSASVRPSEDAKLNLLLTDGQLIVASCWGNTLYWVNRDGVHDCEICGIPHVHHDLHRHYRAVVVASEPISHEAWAPLERGQILSVDSQVRARIQSI